MTGSEPEMTTSDHTDGGANQASVLIIWPTCTSSVSELLSLKTSAEKCQTATHL